MNRVYNFSAGPGMLPEAVLEQVQEALLAWRDSGMSVMEMSHRSKAFLAIAQEAEADLRELMAIPGHYKVLFLQGGASSQFAMAPMNLLGRSRKADYFNTGLWSKKAIAEAKRLGEVNVVASGEAEKFTSIPPLSSWRLDPQAAYVHYTPNETINGVEFHEVPQTQNAPLVADASSMILSRPLDVARHGLIYAGAQKNIGPAGLTVVIVHEDLINEPLPGTPTMFAYRTHAEADSMYNTPPTFAWYVAGLVFKWLKAQGGLVAMAERNQRKADRLYATIDDAGFYHSPVAPAARSRMNVPFTLADPELEARFLTEAKAVGLVALEGHRSVGGLRASLYNAMPEAGVDALIAFMSEFAQRYG